MFGRYYHIDIGSLLASGFDATSSKRTPEEIGAASDRVVLFVHGYNVQIDEAAKAYRQFLKLAEPDRFREPETWVLCTWPGYASIPDPLPNKLRYLYYSNALKKVKAIAPLFFENVIMRFIGHGSRVKEIVVVAHSLGCRLVLEALQEPKKKRHRLKGGRIVLFLLAPAIPTHLIEPLGCKLSATAGHFESFVLYSTRDRALGRGVFGLMQTLCREGSFPEAVGKRGGPRGAAWTGLEFMPFFDHNTFLSHPRTVEAMRRHLGDRLNPMLGKETITGVDIPVQLELFDR